MANTAAPLFHAENVFSSLVREKLFFPRKTLTNQAISNASQTFRVLIVGIWSNLICNFDQFVNFLLTNPPF